jgi:hypothetical protein
MKNKLYLFYFLALYIAMVIIAKIFHLPVVSYFIPLVVFLGYAVRKGAQAHNVHQQVRYLTEMVACAALLFLVISAIEYPEEFVKGFLGR